MAMSEEMNEDDFPVPPSISNDHTLVLAKPRFGVRDVSEQRMLVGERCVLKCPFVATRSSSLRDSRVEMEWLREQQVVHLDHRMTLLPSGTLTISELRLSDSGHYTCRVSNEAGSSTSDPVLLLVDDEQEKKKGAWSPPTFMATPTDTVVLEGESVVLECAANGHPVPKVEWLRDGEHVDLSHLDSRFSVVGIGSLRIQHVNLRDQGTYQCRAENNVDALDASASLYVYSVPKLIMGPKDTVASPKSDVKLMCQAEGVPRPKLKWLKNGESIIESDYFQMSERGDLLILGLVKEDSGVYQCVASNEVGEVQASAQLLVVPQAESMASERWSLFSSSSISSISSSSSSSKPTWSALASPTSNQVSSSSSTAPSLSPLTSPSSLSAPGSLTAIIVSSRFVTLSWSRPPSTLIAGFSVFYRRSSSSRERVLNTTNSDQLEINVAGLRPDTNYEMRVVAFTNEHMGVSSDRIVVRTKDEPRVPVAVKGVRARATSSFSILVLWSSLEEQGITHYKLYYRQTLESQVHSVEIRGQHQFHLSDLREYTEYTFWLSAFNTEGEGTLSSEITCRTFSDIPADPPLNVSLESVASTAIVVRWEPPPLESQNGLITGYKVRWRPSSSARASVSTTSGSSRQMVLDNLRPSRSYETKVAAMTVNGTGPWSAWLSMRTLDNDLDESRAPGQPESLQSWPISKSSVGLVWKTSSNSRSVRVRGFHVEWGRGVPDEHRRTLPARQRRVELNELDENTEYVISVRAFNEAGEGRPIYETVRTHSQDKMNNLDVFNNRMKDTLANSLATTLPPPIGLSTRILSSRAALLTWIDPSLPRNQVVPDQRYYVVRYVVNDPKTKEGSRTRNASDLNLMLDDLLPNTEYAFDVKTVRNKLSSRWSLVALNTTKESAPTSPPRDVHMAIDSMANVLLKWKPPKMANGRIKGYLIEYSEKQRATKWVMETVVGEVTSIGLDDLEAGQKVYVRISARNEHGTGPTSPIVTLNVPQGDGRRARELSPLLLYGLAGLVAGLIIAVVVVCVLVMQKWAKRESQSGHLTRNQKSYLNGEVGGVREKLNPGNNTGNATQELWITAAASSSAQSNGEHLELKSVVITDQDDEDGDVTGDTSLPRSTPILADVCLEHHHHHHGPNVAQGQGRAFQMPYSGTDSETSFSMSSCTSRPEPPSRRSSAMRMPKVAAINGKPRNPPILFINTRDSLGPDQNIGSSSCGVASSTYMRSQFSLLHSSLESPSASCTDEVVGPGYEPSEGQASTIEETQVLIQESKPPTTNTSANMMAMPPAYLSSAMSTSSAESSSGGSSSQTSRLKSFRQTQLPPQHLVASKPIALRPLATSPLKRPSFSPALSSLPAAAAASSSTGSNTSASSSPSCPLAPPPPRLMTTTATSSAGTPMHSGQLPTLANVRSPEVLHPQDGRPCDCLAHPVVRESTSTEELHAEMKHLEGLMKDLGTLNRHPASPSHHH